MALLLFLFRHSGLGAAKPRQRLPRSDVASARIIDSVGVYPFRPIGLDTLRRPGV